MRVAVLALAVALAACENPPSPGGENRLFPDLPAPQGFEYKGYGHQTGEIRTYTQEYTGKRRMDETMKWFKDTYPVHGWALQGETASSLTFTKMEERAVVTFEESAALKVVVKVGKKE
jgi:hypothetical protein